MLDVTAGDDPAARRRIGQLYSDALGGAGDAEASYWLLQDQRIDQGERIFAMLDAPVGSPWAKLSQPSTDDPSSYYQGYWHVLEGIDAHLAELEIALTHPATPIPREP